MFNQKQQQLILVVQVNSLFDLCFLLDVSSFNKCHLECLSQINIERGCSFQLRFTLECHFNGNLKGGGSFFNFLIGMYMESSKGIILVEIWLNRI